MELTKEELKRYSRHLLLSEVGVAGQLKLKKASVLIVGLGGLGSPLAMYLAASGVGRLGLIDNDVVEESNLQRQVIHCTSDVGRLKTDSASDKLKAINPEIIVEQFNEALTSENAMEIIADYDIVADGTDNFQTRYLVNDACVLLGKPNVYGSVYRFEGQTSVFWKKKGPCYRCIYPNPPEAGSVPTCEEAGVLGVLPGIVGMLQSTEVLKLIIGKGAPLIGRLLLYDALEMKFSEIKLKPNPNCKVCGSMPEIKILIDYDKFCGVKKVDEIQSSSSLKKWESNKQMQPQVLSKLLQKNNDLFLLDVRETYEYNICNIKNSILIPMGQIANNIKVLPKDKKIVVICHHGSRSKAVVTFLKNEGFEELYNLEGGIDRFASEVDSSLDRY